MNDKFNELYLKAKKMPLLLSIHCVIYRTPHYNVEENEIETVFKRGKLYYDKCELPEKIAIKLYDGKKKTTVVIIVAVKFEIAKVVTLWIQKGKI